MTFTLWIECSDTYLDLSPRPLEECVNNEKILEQLKTMLKPTQINTNSEDLYDASADRYKKYAKARNVLDVPSPLAIVYPDSPQQVRDLLVFCNTNKINVIPRAGKQQQRVALRTGRNKHSS